MVTKVTESLLDLENLSVAGTLTAVDLAVSDDADIAGDLTVGGSIGLGATPAVYEGVKNLAIGGTVGGNIDFITGTTKIGYVGNTVDALDVGTYGAKPVIIAPNEIERVRFKSTGQMRLVPLAAAPSGAENGDVYYDSTLGKLRVYAAGAWVSVH